MDSLLRRSAAVGAELQKLLARGHVMGHDLAFGELLMGDPGGLQALVSPTARHMQRAATIVHNEVVAFVRERRLHGGGIGWIDVHILASALAGRHQLWTAYAPLAAVAREIGIAY